MDPRGGKSPTNMHSTAASLLESPLVLGLAFGLILSIVLRKLIKAVVILTALCAILIAYGISRGWVDPQWLSSLSVPAIPRADVTPMLGLLSDHFPFAFASAVGFLLGTLAPVVNRVRRWHKARKEPEA